ncbi:unnamed protein product [Closterium sp. NIES-53]
MTYSFTRYSSPASAALGRLILPYLFPELSTFATVNDLITHLRSSDNRYCAALTAEFLDKNPPLMGVPPPPLPPSYASSAAVDILGTEDVRAASAPSGKRRSGKGKGGKSGGGGSGGGSGEGGGGSGGGEGGGGSGGGGGGSGGSGGGGGGGSGSGGSGIGGGRGGAIHRGGSGGGQRQQQQQRPSETPTPQQLREWFSQRGASEGSVRPMPPDPGLEAAALGASESSLPGTAPAEALHTFTLDSGASRCFFYDNTTLTPLPAPVSVRLADPSEGPVFECSSSVLPCPAVPSGSLTGLHLPSFSTNLPPVRIASSRTRLSFDTTALVTPPCHAFVVCTPAFLFLVFPGLCLPSHPRLPRPAFLASRGGNAPLLTPPRFPPTIAPLQSLHMDMWGPARVSEQSRERYFLLAVEDYTRYTTVFPLRSKGEVPDVLMPWIRTVCLQLRERFREDLPVLRLHSDRGGEFSSDLLRDFCRGEGILHSFTLPASPHQNGVAERRIGLVMEVARTSMIHATAPHFLWSFAVRYAAHQLNLWPCVSLSETSPTLRWTGEVGDASVFRDVTFDESVPFYRLFPYRTAPLPSPPLFVTPRPPPVDPLPPQGPASSGVSQVDPLPLAAPVDVTVDSNVAGGAAARGAASGGAELEGAESRGAEPESAEPWGAEPEGAESGGAESEGAKPRGTASAGGPAGASPRHSRQREPLSPQQLREWFARHTRLRSGAARAGGPAVGGTRAGYTGVSSPGGAGGTAGAGGVGAGSTGGAGAAGPRGARTKGTGAAGAGGVGGAGAGGAGAGGTGAGGAGARDTGAGGAGTWGARAGGTGARGIVQQRPFFVPPPLSSLPPPGSVLHQPMSCLALLVCAVRTGLRVPRPCPRPVPGTHIMALRPSYVPLQVSLLSPPASSLDDGPDPEFDLVRAARPTVTRLLATVVTDPSFESTAPFALVAELVDFADANRLNYAASLVAESESDCPPSVGGECALGTDVLEDKQEDFECLAIAVPHLVAMLLAHEGDPDAPNIPTPRSYAEAITGPYSSQWQTVMDAEMASWKSTSTYVDAVPPPRANIVDDMWIFKVKRPLGSPPVFKARYVARGFSQRQGVDFFQTFSPTPKMTTLRVLLHVAAQRDYELHLLEISTAFSQGNLHEEKWLRRPPGFTGSFLVLLLLVLITPHFGYGGTQWSLRRPVHGLRQAPHEWHDTLRAPVAALGFAPSTADPSLFLRTDTSLPPFYILVYVLQRFGFRYSLPQSTPLPTGHSLSAPPLDESVEPSGPYPELVGCLITSGMGLVLVGWGPVVLTGHADASWVDDLATQRSSSCEAEIYAGALVAQELRWLTYLLTDLGEPPRSPPILTKHIALRYFLARELLQRSHLCLAYVASRANTADIFTKALQPCDRQPCLAFS